MKETTSTTRIPATNTHGEPTKLGEYNGFEIYPMPFFATLVVDDPSEVAWWYERALGFGVMFAGPVVHLRRRKYQDILVVSSKAPGPRPAGGPSLHFSADGEVDELAARAKAATPCGLSSIDGPVDTRWNTRDLRVTDPAGNHLVFTSRPEAPNVTHHEQWREHFEAGKRS